MNSHNGETITPPNHSGASYDSEKIGVQELERTTTEINNADISEFSPEEQKRIIRRIDLRLVTTLGVLYMCSLMDRTNLSAANIAGMAKGLKLIDNRYTTVVMRKMGPRIFLTTIVVLWGGCMIGFGFVKKWDQMVGLRVLLGVLEAGFFPGCAYLLMASAISGILAYGIMQMNGIANLSGWRWIFIIEGLITIVFGIAGYFLIVDFPEMAASSWKFLTPRETAFVVARIQADRADALPTQFNITEYLKNALDSKVWGFACLFGLTTTNSYAIAYFLPVILVRGMGFSVAAGQCLVAPPYVAAGIAMFGMAVVGDKYHVRGPIVIFGALLGMIGLPMLGYATNNGVRYFGVFLATISANANIPAILTYQANNIRGQWKRALCSATLVGFGGIGGIIGSTVFREHDAPKYGPGIMTCLIANGKLVSWPWIHPITTG
ncbi:putative Uncharacterized transporter [Glarea lozoyensis 74030]|uniref:Putative Uncharacterized transporter n=1 Tax=Glarea lozoyensis (strain ATCC 74030 / MF5533) TaxID=1104152 RepID=H0EPC4_GLAL7|nr:putative Uncharacterized transporter [Glarea lozoyensis 74030]